MGLLYAHARMLLAAHRDGFKFTEVATLGRQQVFIYPEQFDRLVDEFGHSASGLRDYRPAFGEYCEPFLQR